MANLVTHRHRAFVRQNGRCCYCGMPVVPHSHLSWFASQVGLSEKYVKALQCTAEHLEAKCDGGADHAANIAAACVTCNQRRHRMHPALPPDQYRDLVQRQMTKGCWHKRALVKETLRDLAELVPRVQTPTRKAIKQAK